VGGHRTYDVGHGLPSAVVLGWLAGVGGFVVVVVGELLHVGGLVVVHLQRRPLIVDGFY